jgi:alpha-beta hydrolase superfamily lysophospholipase
VQPFQELNVPVGDRNLNIVKFGTGATKKGIVLYFHGNMRNIERYASYAKTFTKAGYELWMMDYPGFGKSTGKLTEEILYRDAALMYGMAREEVAAGEIIIMESRLVPA